MEIRALHRAFSHHALGSAAAQGQHELLQPVKEPSGVKTAAVEARNQLPLVSVSLQDVCFPPLRSVAAVNVRAAAAPAQPGPPLHPPGSSSTGYKAVIEPCLCTCSAPGRDGGGSSCASPARSGSRGVNRPAPPGSKIHPSSRYSRRTVGVPEKSTKRGPAKLCSSCEGLFLSGGSVGNGST